MKIAIIYFLIVPIQVLYPQSEYINRRAGKEKKLFFEYFNDYFCCIV